jgi:hypothetical protein
MGFFCLGFMCGLSGDGGVRDCEPKASPLHVCPLKGLTAATVLRPGCATPIVLVAIRETLVSSAVGSEGMIFLLMMLKLQLVWLLIGLTWCTEYVLLQVTTSKLHNIENVQKC